MQTYLARITGIPRRWRMLGLTMGIAVLLGIRVAAVFTVAVNWDEFALFNNARLTAETGQLQAGGRPGLASVLLLPFVADCNDEIDVIRRARVLWLAFTFALLVGFAALIAQLQPDPRRRLGDALLGVALLAAVPAFLEWSLQVRTDQIALAAGLWGGVALLTSRRRPPVALATGLLFGLGYLASQKLVYVAALVVLLAVGQLARLRDLRPRREATRASLALAGFGLAFAAWRLATASAFGVPETHASQQVMTPAFVNRGLSVFEFYRHTIGFSQYRAMLPMLAPHFLLLAALAAASILAVRRVAIARGALALAWAVLLLGLAVGGFHAGAFFYFWMTLGLFPAAAFATARGPIQALLRPAAARLVVAGWWLLLLLPGLVTLGLMLNDTQSVQRESLAFVHRNFTKADAGFHPESALFCRDDLPPLRGARARSQCRKDDPHLREQAHQVHRAVVPAESVPGRAAAILGGKLPALPGVGLRGGPASRGGPGIEPRVRPDRPGRVSLATHRRAAVRSDRRSSGRRGRGGAPRAAGAHGRLRRGCSRRRPGAGRAGPAGRGAPLLLQVLLRCALPSSPTSCRRIGFRSTRRSRRPPAGGCGYSSVRTRSSIAVGGWTRGRWTRFACAAPPCAGASRRAGKPTSIRS
jgi:hypothetical protein